jgi:apolipoprotein N-acyltransferase
LIIWPEAASPGLFGQDDDIFERFYALTKKIKIPILLGAVTRSKDIFFNSALLIGSDGRIAGRYDKLHLVPFGEYIPLKKFLPFLETVVPIGDINAGKEYTIFQIRNPKSQIRNKFAVLICFEDLFPELSREFVKRGAGFLVNITNDAWYKSSTAPYQHLQASVLRAVENRVTLARAANTGISGFISPHGKIISLVRDKYRRNIFIDGFDTEYVSPGKGELSFYTRFGDIFIACCLIFLFYGIIWYNTEI